MPDSSRTKCLLVRISGGQKALSDPPCTGEITPTTRFVGIRSDRYARSSPGMRAGLRLSS
jgi:hypothetical protein